MKKINIIELGKKAIEDARRENFVFGLPNVISQNGKILYELPTGEIKETFNWNIYKKSLTHLK